jgi:peptide/nickel transport system substrate-binding protein
VARFPTTALTRIAALLLAAGCGAGETLPAERALVWARSADSATLDPAETEWGEDLKVVASLYETLVSIDAETLQPAPRLARSWTLAKDGKSVTFDLREGVRFHDGTSLTSEAVAFTFARLLQPAHPHRPRTAPFESNFSPIAEVRAEGERRVTFHFKTPFRLPLHVLALPGASIVSPQAVRRHGAAFAANPSGTGPYRLGRWERDVKMELQRFEEYWGEKPPIPRVVVVPVASPQTGLEKLRRGEVHVLDHPAPADLLKLGNDAAARAVLQPPFTVLCLGFNLKRAPYSDVRFRRAVAMAIDRAALNAFGYQGLAAPAWDLVPPALRADLPPVPESAPDLEKAKALLSELRLASREVDLIHVAIPRPYMPEPARVAEFLKDSLRKIGLEVKLTAYDKSAYGQKTREDNHPMILLGWKGDYPDPDNYLHPLLHGTSLQNQSFFDDPEFNRAVEAARSEFDPARRRDLYAKASDRHRELVPTVPLVHLGQALAVRREVDYRPHPFELRFYQARFTGRE